MLLTISSSESMFEKDESPCKAAERSAQASPSDAMSHPTHRSSSTTEKPFFIMDWLEQVDPKAIALAQQILQTPLKHATPTIKADPSSSLKEVRKDLFTPNPSHFLQRSISIGNGYNAKGIQKARQGDWEKALDCWNNALEIRSQILGESHVDVANTLNNIGIALGKLNRSEEAIVSLHRAFEIRIDHYGPEHAEVAATLHNIGNIYQLHGDFEAAIHYFCQCKLLQENIFGSSDNVEVARACIAMGHTYFRAKAFLDAREAYTDALLIFQHIGLPDDDPEVQATIDDIRDLDQNILYRQH